MQVKQAQENPVHMHRKAAPLEPFRDLERPGQPHSVSQTASPYLRLGQRVMCVDQLLEPIVDDVRVDLRRRNVGVAE